MAYELHSMMRKQISQNGNGSARAFCALFISANRIPDDEKSNGSAFPINTIVTTAELAT
jgi:hypothetical protein